LLPEVIIPSDEKKNNKLNNDEINEKEDIIDNNKSSNILKELSFVGQFNKISYVNLRFNNPQENKYFTEFDYSTSTPLDKLNRIVNLCTSYTLLNCLPFDIKIIFNDEFTYEAIHKNEKINLTNISAFSTLRMKLFINEYSTKTNYVIYDNYIMKDNYSTMSIILTSDDENDKSEIVIQVTLNNKLIILHANSILVNHTDLQLSFKSGYKSKNINKIISNQKEDINYYILNDEQFIQISYEKKDLINNNDNNNININLNEEIEKLTLELNEVNNKNENYINELKEKNEIINK
jgi:hypothetical protein